MNNNAKSKQVKTVAIAVCMYGYDRMRRYYVQLPN